MTKRLSVETYNKAQNVLSKSDPDLKKIIDRFGKPPLWHRPGGYRTLVLLILEQQVSLLSARATFTRLSSTAGKLTPEHALELTDTQYRAAGVSRQKTRYIRDLSECILNKTVRIGRLPHLDDENVREHLTKVKGIGLWTADVYLLISLQRSDIWPVGDIALQAATHDIKGLEARPNPAELSQIGEQWRPWRSVAARILWHYYLSKSGKK